METGPTGTPDPPLQSVSYALLVTTVIALAITPHSGKNTCVKETAFHSHLPPGHGPAGHSKQTKSLKLEKVA